MSCAALSTKLKSSSGKDVLHSFNPDSSCVWGWWTKTCDTALADLGVLSSGLCFHRSPLVSWLLLLVPSFSEVGALALSLRR